MSRQKEFLTNGMMQFGSASRRSVLKGTAALGTAAALGAVFGRGSQANAATTLNFQTSAGARFGTPNAALITDFNAKNPDLQVVMETVPVQNYFPKLSTEVASNAANLEVFTGITNLLYAFAATGKIVPFDEVFTPEQIAEIEKDIPAKYLDTWRYKGKLYAIPNDSNAQWSFYRKDLFEAAGVTPPQKWEDAVAVAKALTKDGVYGYTASLRRGEYAGAHFSSILFSYGGEYWDADFNPMLNTDAAKKAIQIMLDLMPYADPGTINAGEDDTAQVIASGVAAWAPLEWGRSDLTDAAKIKTADQIETTVPPDGGDHPAAPCLGGQAYMIASWAPDKAAAAKWVGYATSSEVMRTFVANQGQPARSSALNDPENVKIGRYFPTLQKVLAQGHPFPAIPESYQFLVELGNHVADILTGTVSADQGLQNANDAFAKQLKDAGYL
ncbi:MAG: sugar ABC transporter substrate-binding protein [Rhizobiaceae bacterium]|nr:sugar ABC transporter substrate-binding protein [Rhizobiaceae bacterium]